MSTFFSNYEVLSQPLIPGNANVPYVTQGVFVQIVNPDINNSLNIAMQFNFGEPFQATNDPDNPSDATIALMIEYIDGTGTSIPYSVTDFLQYQSLNIEIAAGSTYILGIQYIYTNAVSAKKLGTTPLDSLASRGLLQISADYLDAYQILVTTRQFFTTYDASSNVDGMTGAAYVNPVFQYSDNGRRSAP